MHQASDRIPCYLSDVTKLNLSLVKLSDHTRCWPSHLCGKAEASAFQTSHSTSCQCAELNDRRSFYTFNVVSPCWLCTLHATSAASVKLSYASCYSDSHRSRRCEAKRPNYDFTVRLGETAFSFTLISQFPPQFPQNRPLVSTRPLPFLLFA